MVDISSAAGVLSLLDESDPQLQIQALEILSGIVDEFWAEISDYVDQIKSLCDNKGFPQRELAALILSKVYYNLANYDDALTYALAAGTRFNPTDKSPFVQTLVSKCIDKYIAIRTGEAAGPVDPRMEAVVNNMFRTCLDRLEIKQAIGIALEARRMDILREAVKRAPAQREMINYCKDVCMTLIQSREFRNQLLRELVSLYLTLDTKEYNSVCQCLTFLDDDQRVAEILASLIGQGEDETLAAYQVAADVEENAPQHFITRLRKALPRPDGVQDTGSVDKETYEERLRHVDDLLSGEIAIGLHLEYLYRNRNIDMLLLKNTKNAIVRNSACHQATVLTNAYIHAGTSVHQFLHDNLDWLARATNWAKFSATASLGVIHKGNLKDSRNVLSKYLPQEVSQSPYSEGGSLFALGLIHANHGDDVIDYLVSQLHQESTPDPQHREILQHGAALGLGCAAMATENMEVYEQLQHVLHTDSAVAGEAAGLAMGLVMLGSANASVIEEMLNYAHETQHEKIIRGLALGIALVMYGREEEADSLIDTLCADKDPILRFSGMHTIAMAYIGTANNRALLKLLHFAVSDVNDDVRRSAVTSLGFLLFRVPHQCPPMVSLLTESYNAHVRYGAALALGFACAGTGMKEALDLLEPMTTDGKNFVRQGALVAQAMICIQQSEAKNPLVANVRKNIEKVVHDKNDDGKTGDVSAKFGAILGQGIIDAGGRNVTISLDSRGGHSNMMTAVGLLVFSQFWFWYPFANFLGLAFTPTTLIALNKDLKMPKMQFRSNAKPSLFAYPPETKPPQAEAKEKITTAVLSISQKHKNKKKGADEAEEPKPDEMTVDKPDADAEKKDEGGMEVDKPAEAGDAQEPEKKEAEPEPEPDFSMLDNPARVTVQQRRHIAMPDARWAPMRELAGIVIVKDTTPDEAFELVELTAPKAEGGDSPDEKEPSPPEPFEFESDKED